AVATNRFGDLTAEFLGLERRQLQDVERLVVKDRFERGQKVLRVDQAARSAVEVTGAGVGHVEDERTRVGSQGHSTTEIRGCVEDKLPTTTVRAGRRAGHESLAAVGPCVTIHATAQA